MFGVGDPLRSWGPHGHILLRSCYPTLFPACKLAGGYWLFLEWFLLLFLPPELSASPLDGLENFTKDESSLSLEAALLFAWQNARVSHDKA